MAGRPGLASWGWNLTTASQAARPEHHGAPALPPPGKQRPLTLLQDSTAPSLAQTHFPGTGLGASAWNALPSLLWGWCGHLSQEVLPLLRSWLYFLCPWCLQGLDRAPEVGPAALQGRRADPVTQDSWAKHAGGGQPPGRDPRPAPLAQPPWGVDRAKWDGCCPPWPRGWEPTLCAGRILGPSPPPAAPPAGPTPPPPFTDGCLEPPEPSGGVVPRPGEQAGGH